MLKVGGATKEEFIEWVNNELTPPIICGENTQEFLKVFLELLKSNDTSNTHAVKWYEKSLCWLEDGRAEFLKPQWIELSDVERYIHKAYIDFYDNLKQ